MRPEKRTRVWPWAPAALVLLGLLAWRGILSNGFVYDDAVYIVQNDAVRSLTPASKFFRAESQFPDPARTHEVWRPATLFVYALDYRAAGLSPWTYHLTSLFLHLLDALMVFGLIAGLFRSRRTAFVAAAVFLLHPVQVESVAWISGLSNPLYLAFYLAAALLFLRWKKRGSRAAYAASLLCFALSLLSKEMAVTLPLTLGLIQLLRRKPGESRWAAAKPLIPYAALAAAYVVARTVVLGRVGQTGYWAGALLPQMLTMLKGFAVYVRLLLAPHSLGIEYLFAVKRGLDAEVLACGLLLAGLLAFAARRFRSDPKTGFGLLLFFVSLAPVANVIPINTIINERYLYLAVLGWGLIAARLLVRRGALGLACLTALCGAYAVIDCARIPDWKDDYALAASGLKTCPQSARLHFAMGKAHAGRGEWDAAIAEYRTALAVELQNGPSPEAESLARFDAFGPELTAKAAEYRRTVQVSVDRGQTFYDIGTAYLEKGDTGKAAAYLEQAKLLMPGDAQTLNNLAAAYAEGGAPERGIAELKELLDRHPENDMARRNLKTFAALLQARAAATPLTDQIRTRFPQMGPRLNSGLETELTEASLAFDGRTLPGFTPKAGFLGSAQDEGSLKPEERAALEAMARRDGGRSDAAPPFFLPKNFGTVAINANAARLDVTPATPQAFPVPLVQEPGAAVYRNAYPGADVLYVAGPGSLEQMYWLDRPGAKRFTSRIRAGGRAAALRLERDKVAVLDESGHEILTLTPPEIFDARGRSKAGSYALETEGGRSWKLTLSFDDAGLQYPLLIDPTWIATSGNMTAAMTGQTATLLPNGQVLIAGGTGSGYVSTAQLYNPATGAWTAVGNMSVARGNHTATLLPTGQVLVAGGHNSGTILSTSELYNPATQTWSVTSGNLVTGRYAHTATLLSNGLVLVAGGQGNSGYLSSSELYNPATQTWAATTGNLNVARWDHTATLLLSGQVLVAGGSNSGGASSTSELYNPVAQTWSLTSGGDMVNARYQHTATLLPNGQVLVAGGVGSSYLSTTELYTPGTQSWASTNGNLNTSRGYHSATLLPNGQVLVTGGYSGSIYLSTTELYNPAAGTWSFANPLLHNREFHTATLLADGQILIAGGDDGTAYSVSELYAPFAGTWASVNSMNTTRNAATATLLPSGKILVAGGNHSGSATTAAEVYDPVAGTWTPVNPMNNARYGHTATLLANGNVLVAGGFNSGGTAFNSVEIYYSTSGVWSTVTSMSTTRADHTATLLASGKVLVTGGENSSASTNNNAEVYDPVANAWTGTADTMNDSRMWHTSTLLANGQVLIAGGGFAGSTFGLNIVDLYNPATSSFTEITPMNAARRLHTATVLPSGQVLVAGGDNTGTINEPELFTPGPNTWAYTGTMSAAREQHTATALPGGRVLVAGGTSGGSLSSAEIYDPGTAAWYTTSPLAVARSLHTATLMANGQILLAGGDATGNSAETAALTEYGAGGYNAAMQPSIATINGFSSAESFAISASSGYTLGGTNFLGLGEGSGGNAQTSPTNYPRVTLQRFDSGGNSGQEESAFLIDRSSTVYPQTSAQWQTASTSFSFTMAGSTLPAGYYMLTAWANGVPSTAAIVNFNPALPAADCPTTSLPAYCSGGGEFVSKSCTPAYPTIQAAINALPTNLTGPACILIEDNSVYGESVTVQGITTNNHVITILTDPAVGGRATVSPVTNDPGFTIANSSVALVNIDVEILNNANYGIVATAPTVFLTSVAVVSPGDVNTAGIAVTSGTTINFSSVAIQTDGDGFLLSGTGSSISNSTAVITIGGFYALSLASASETALNADAFVNTVGTAAYLSPGSNFNTISASTMTGGTPSAGNGTPGGIALSLNDANSNSIVRSVLLGGGGGSAASSGGGAGGTGLFMIGSSSNTVFASTMSGGGSGGSNGGGGNGSGGTIVSGGTGGTGDGAGTGVNGPGGYGLYASGGSSITVTFDLMFGGGGGGSDVGGINPGGNGGAGLFFGGTSSGTVSQSFMLGGGGGAGAGGTGGFGGGANGGASGTPDGGGTANGGDGGAGAVFQSAANGDFIFLSTTTGGTGGTGHNPRFGAAGSGAAVIQSAGDGVFNSYVLGSTAVWVNGSTGTAVGGCTLVASSGTGSGLWLEAGSQSVTLSSSVITGGAAAAGVWLDAGNTGATILSSNTINPGSLFGVYAVNQSAGAQIWITSNTILPSAINGASTYGLYFTGLLTGATVQNNGFYYRSSVNLGAGAAYALHLLNSSGLVIDHNRIDDPGSITGGSFHGAWLSGTTNTVFKFNDLFVNGSALANGFLMELYNNSTGVTVKDNIFFSSMTVGGSTATIVVDGGSETGFVSDYNDYFSFYTANAAWWGNTPQILSLLPGWFATTGQDAHSIALNPLWFNTSSGAEDFHPQSNAVNGRCVSGNNYVFTGSPCTTFVQDGFESPVIDAADPAEPFGNEILGGHIADLGSTGNTVEASKSDSPNACNFGKTVCLSGCNSTTINGALSQFPATLSGATCVDIKDSRTYNEAVVIENFVMNGSSLTIMSSPGNFASVTPTTSNLAVFQIANSSVSLVNLAVAPEPGPTQQYGILASSPNVTITSVSVTDNPGYIAIADIELYGWDSVSYSSVTEPHNAVGFQLTGSSDSIFDSTASVGGSGFALLLSASSGDVITQSYFANSVGTAAFIAAGSDLTSISQSTFTAGDIGYAGLVINGASTNTLTQVVIIGGTGGATANGGAGLMIVGGSSDTINFSTMTGGLGGTLVSGTGLPGGAGLFVNAGSSVTAFHSVLNGGVGGNDGGGSGGNGAGGSGAFFQTSGGYHQILQSLVLGGAGGNEVGIDASGNGGDALVFQTGLNNNTVNQSTAVGGNGGLSTGAQGTGGNGGRGLYLFDSGSNMVAESMLIGGVGGSGGNHPGGAGANGADIVAAGSSNNTISLSTMTGGHGGLADAGFPDGNGGNGLSMNGSGSNSFSQCAMIGGASGDPVVTTELNGNGGYGALLLFGANNNVIALSTMTGGAGGGLTALYTHPGGAGGHGLELNESDADLVTQSVMTAGPAGIGTAVGLAANGAFFTTDANSNAITLSTITSLGNAPALNISSSTNDSLFNSYVQGSTAVYVFGSTTTSIGGSVLFGGAGGSGLDFTAGSKNLALSSSVITAAVGFQSAGVFLDQFNFGLLVLSSNTFLTGPEADIFVATQSVGTSVWITSNTISPTVVNAGYNTYGIYTNGLLTGATIQNNSLYYRGAGSMGTSGSYGLYLLSSRGLNIDHNRINDPGAITVGGFFGVEFAGTSNSSLKFNDINGSGSSLLAAYMIGAQSNSTGIQIRDNIVASSFTVSNASGTLIVDTNSELSFNSDYNDFFSSNGVLSIIWGGLSRNFPWNGAPVNQDAHSISANPLWFNAAANTEDFHPLSVAGRFNAAGAVFHDGATSPTIDAADPAELLMSNVELPTANVGSEPTPNGALANQGSYGQTDQASESSPPAGCATAKFVRQAGGEDSMTIGGAIGLLGGSLTGNTCIYVADSATYGEQVNVQNIATGGFTLTISPDPSLNVHPVVAPNLATDTAAFVVANASVNISGFQIQPAASISYGILASSPNVTIASVSVLDTLSEIGTAGISISSWTTLTGSTVNVNDATGLIITSDDDSILASSVSASNINFSAVAVGGSSETFTGLSASGAGAALYLNPSSYDTISQSTMITSGNNATALFVIGSSDVVSRSFLRSPNGYAVFTTGGNLYDTIQFSTAVTANGNDPTINANTSSFTIVGSYILNTVGVGVLFNGGNANTISLSTVNAADTGAAGAIYLGGGDTIIQSFVQSNNGGGIVIPSGGNFNSISGSTISADLVSLSVTGASNTITGNYLFSVFGGISLYGANNVFSFDTTVGSIGLDYVGGAYNTVTNSFLAGTNGVRFEGGAGFNLVAFSTIDASGDNNAGLEFFSGSSNTVTNCYVEGSTAVWVDGSSASFVGASYLQAGGSGNVPVWMNGGSSGLLLSSNTVRGGALSPYGVWIDQYNSGTIILSTNTILPNAAIGIGVATQTAGTSVWITSNTVLPELNPAFFTCGIGANGLTTGATIQNNGIYFRASGPASAMGTNGLCFQAASNLVIDHNRINDPGMITAGSFFGANFTGTTNSSFKFNDVNAVGSSLATVYLFEAASGSTGLQVRDNIFVSSMSATALAAIVVDALSESGLNSDYNDYFSSSGVNNGIYGGTSYGMAATWSANTFGNQDSNSITVNPLWFNTAAGVEDFHPLSAVARCGGVGNVYAITGGPACTYFTDAVQSPTIDAADPAELSGNEPSPNGAIANLGSTGNTVQASKSVAAACATIRKVCKNGTCDYYSIQSAVNSLPATLTGQTCIYVEDSSTYSEEVTVQGFVTGGSTITISPDPALPVHPILNPLNAVPGIGFDIQNASVTISGFTIQTNAAINYGIFVSSPNVTIASMTVLEGTGHYGFASVLISSCDVVSYSTITASAGNGLEIVGSHDSVVHSTASTDNNGTYALYLNGASSGTITSFGASNPMQTSVFLNNAANNTISLSSMTSNSSNVNVEFNNSSSNTITRSYLQNLFGGNLLIQNSNSNTISLTTATNNGGNADVSVSPGSSNTFTSDFFANGSATAWDMIQGSYNTISFSTMTGNSTSDAATLSGGVANTVTQCYIANAGGGIALHLEVSGGGPANGGTVSFSTMAVNAGGSAALYLNGVSSNSVTDSVMLNPSGVALKIDGSGSYNVVGLSALTSGSAGLRALDVNVANYNAVTQSVISNPNGLAAYIYGVNGNTVGNVISFSTLTSNASFPGLNLSTVNATVVAGDYIQGAEGLLIVGSSGTIVEGSTLAATSAQGAGLWLTGGSDGLSVSSSVLLAGSQGAGVLLDQYNSGLIVLSTNSFPSGAQEGIAVSTQTPGTQVWITSNTIVPTITNAQTTYGLLFNGLTSGATVEQNNVYYRGTPGSVSTAYALYSQGSAGLQIDHNRVNEPGVINGGNFIAISFNATTMTTFKFNDVNASGSGLGTAIVTQWIDSSSGVVKDNVFSNGLSGGAQADIFNVDAVSEGGFVSNDNDLFITGGGATFGKWGGGVHQTTLAGWQGVSAQDAQSLSANPLWENTAAGAEDFHPQTAASSGRYDQADGLYDQTDAGTSPTIDAADPLEPFALEPFPNGTRANQGSYGDTTQASKSPQLPGCDVEYTVSAGGGSFYGNITAAVNAVAAASPLSLNTCVVIRSAGPDGGTYAEQVSIQNIAFSVPNKRLTVMGAPNLFPRAIVNPGGATTAGFVVANASVTIYNLDIKPSGGTVPYAILASSAFVTISSVNVDAGGEITTAGVAISSWTSVAYTSITVQNSNGLQVVGTGATVFDSTAAAAGAGVNDAVFLDASSYGSYSGLIASDQNILGRGLYLYGASSNSFTAGTITANNGYAAVIDTGSNDNSIAQSTMTSFYGGGYGLLIESASSNTVTGSVIAAANGTGAALAAGANNNTISLTSLQSGVLGDAALIISGSSNTVSQNVLTNAAGYALWLTGTAWGNTVSLSSAANSNSSNAAVYLNGASSNTISQTYVSNGAGTGILIDLGAGLNTIRLSTAVANASGAAVSLNGAASSSNTIVQSVMVGNSAEGLSVFGSYDSFSQDAMLCNAIAGACVSLNAASYDAFSQDFVTNTGYAVTLIGGSSYDTFSQSTMATTSASFTRTVSLLGVSSVTIANSYIQGPPAAGEAILIQGSTGTVLTTDLIFAPSSGVFLTQGSVNLNVSSSAISAGAGFAAIDLDLGNSGRIEIATNTIYAGPQYGLYALGQQPGTTLHVASNTVIPTVLNAGYNTYGLYFNGLTTGATIFYNGIYYRTPGSMGSSQAFGLYAANSSGLVINHNRIDEPGMISAGSYTAVGFNNTFFSSFKFNDVSSSGTALAGAYLFQLTNSISAGDVVKDNAFSSFWTLAAINASSAAISVDSLSEATFASDYNDFFSSNAFDTGFWGGVSYSLLSSTLAVAAGSPPSAWSAAATQDQHSISANPLWFNPSSGVEDFHPLSKAGRCTNSPLCTTVADDPLTSPTIDAADPAEPVKNEQAPNGGRANQGSYGQTIEASLSPAGPSAPVLVALASTTATIGYTLAPGEFPDFYEVDASTSANFTGTVYSSETALGSATSLVPQGLTANTTYYFRAGAIWKPGTVVYAPGSLSTSTLAGFPAAGLLNGVGFNTITANWGAGGNPGGTLYDLQTSSTPGFIGLTSSSFTYNVSVSSAGLAPNTTYYFQVAALNNNLAMTPFTALGSTSTLAVPPGPAASTFTAVTGGGLTLNWSSGTSAGGGNAPGTIYLAQISTDPAFATAVYSSQTANLFAAFAGLSSELTYNAQVEAISNDGFTTGFVAFGSTTTPASPPLPANPVFTAVGSAALTANWLMNGDPSGTTYYAQISTNANFNTITASSATYNLFATFSGLSADTTYYVQAAAFNINTATWTAFANLASTSTLGLLPGFAANAFTAVNLSSITVTWGTGGNPVGTLYDLQASTVPGFAGVTTSSLTYNLAVNATGLYENTTYYFQVASVDNDGVTSAFNSLGSTSTLAASPVISSITVVSSSTLMVNLNPNGDPSGTLFLVLTSTDPNPISPQPGSVVTSSITYKVCVSTRGLLSDTTYYFAAEALNNDGVPSSFTAISSTMTLAAPPGTAFPTFTSVQQSSIAVAWSLGANSAGLEYLAQASANNFATVYGSSTTANLAAVLGTTGGGPALNPNTTYFFQVQAIDGSGLSTSTVLGSTATLAAPPAPAGQTFLTISSTSFVAAWSANGNPLGVTTYTVVVTTGAAYPNSLPGNMTYSTAPAGPFPSATLTGLTGLTTYYLFVSAVNFGGYSTTFTALGSTVTVAVSSPSIVDAQTGDPVWRAGPSSATYNVGFQDFSGSLLSQFQVEASTMPGGVGPFLIGFTPVVTNINSDNYFTPWSLPPAVFSALLEGPTNYITVKVINGAGDSAIRPDAFYVLKDTTPPFYVNGEAGGVAAVAGNAGTVYSLQAFDRTSGLAAFQYSASLNNTGDASVITWTDITPLVVAGSTYSTPTWQVNFPALTNSATNYISVRSWDVAGTTSTFLNAFYVLKDTAGPTVGITVPNQPFLSALYTISGTAADFFGVKGVEVNVQQNPPGGLYFSADGTFDSASPVWLVASGTSSWTLTPPAPAVVWPWTDSTHFQIVARSSDTAGIYSQVYSTTSFIMDLSTPTIGVSSPTTGATMPSPLTLISGTALDPGTAPSGLSLIQISVQRRADNLWWNFFTDAWSNIQVSTTLPGATAWSYNLDPNLEANLANNASYYIAVAASDNAFPPNVSSFTAGGSTFTFVDTTPPAPVANLAGTSGAQPGQINLAWTSPGDDGNTGIILAGHYAVGASTFPTFAFSTATALVIFSTTTPPGAAQGYTLGGLIVGDTYYVYLWTEDTAGNWSGLSNGATAQAEPAPLNAIEGEVMTVSTQGITGVELDAYNTAGNLVGTTFSLADGSGTFVLSGLSAGSYQVLATWTVNGVASSVALDSIAMGSVGIDFVLNLSYTLGALAGNLQGTTPTAFSSHATMSVASYSYRPAGSTSNNFVELWQRGKRISQVYAQSDGHWQIPNLLPGSYQARAYNGLAYTPFLNVNVTGGVVQDVIFSFDPLPDDAVFNFPNPARTMTWIRFQSALQPLTAEIEIFDVAGDLIYEIPAGQVPNAQITNPSGDGLTYHAAWNLTNTRGASVASGVYLYMVKIQGGSSNQTSKVIKKLAVVK